MRPYRLLGTRQTAALLDQARRIVSAWAIDWLRDGRCETVLRPASPAAAEAPGAWISLHAGGAGCFVRRTPGTIETALFGPQAGGSRSALATEVGDTALADLARRCVGAAADVPGGADAPPADEWRTASGSAWLQLRGTDGAIELLLDGALTARWLAAGARPTRAHAPVLHGLRQALGAARLHLEASAGSVQVDVATWQSLNLGDVLLLEQRTDRPLRLSVAGQPVARGAYLGCRGEHRALQLTAEAGTDPIRPEGTHEH